MNARYCTGYLPADCWDACTPANGSTPAQRKLLFDLIVKTSRGVEFPERCVVDDATLIREYEALLTAGRAVTLEGEPSARPFEKRGVHSGWVREVIVRRIEFHNRGGKKAPNAESAEAAA